MGILTPKGIYHVTTYLLKHGVNTMLLLYLAAHRKGTHVALIDDREEITYKELYNQSNSLAVFLRYEMNIRENQKVAFLCKNHASLIRYIFAASRLGATIYLLNTGMSARQFNELIDIHNFDLLIYDDQFKELITSSGYSNKKLNSNRCISEDLPDKHLPKSSISKIILLTGGTTGQPKEVTHKPSVTNFLQPFLALIERLKLPSHQTVYIATPIFHGYGIAILLVFFALGKKVVITKQFDVEKACKLIKIHQVEVVTVVPLMLHRLLAANTQALSSLRCIASGGAKLSPTIIERTRRSLGEVLYNLYGTSEAGLNIIATPQDLALSTQTIGRPIKGTKIKIVDEEGMELPTGGIGQLCFQNNWSMKNRTSNLIQTGDLGYVDEKGLFFLKGRKDEMVISAGQNIFPSEIEHIILSHPFVEDTAVVGMEDEEYGQKLVAFIQLSLNCSLSTPELMEWLRPQIAKFQLPKEVLFVSELPYSSVGKLQKRKLEVK